MSSTTGKDAGVVVGAGSRMMKLNMIMLGLVSIPGLALLATNLYLTSETLNHVEDKDAPVAPGRDTLSPLDGRLPSTVLNELERITVTVGSLTFTVDVNEIVKYPSMFAMHGVLLHLDSAHGMFTLDGPTLEFDDKVRGYMKKLGVPLVRGHNKVDGPVEITGHFTALDPRLAALASPTNEFPDFSKTFTATVRTLYGCADGDRDTCALSELRDSHVITHDNKSWAVGSHTIWSDAASGKVFERFHTMPYLMGWRLDRMHNVNTMTSRSAQVWEATGEHYYCVEEEKADPTAFGLVTMDNTSKMHSVKLGTLELDGHNLTEYRMKHQEATGHLTQMLVHTATGYPYRMMINIFDIHDETSVQQIAHLYDTFDPKTPDASNFLYPGETSMAAGALFNETICATTIGYTTRYENSSGVSIPIKMDIKGPYPFKAPDDAPDSTEFFWDLQVDPTLTAQQWYLTHKKANDKLAAKGFDLGLPSHVTHQDNCTWPNACNDDDILKGDRIESVIKQHELQDLYGRPFDLTNGPHTDAPGFYHARAINEGSGRGAVKTASVASRRTLATLEQIYDNVPIFESYKKPKKPKKQEQQSAFEAYKVPKKGDTCPKEGEWQIHSKDDEDEDGSIDYRIHPSMQTYMERVEKVAHEMNRRQLALPLAGHCEGALVGGKGGDTTLCSDTCTIELRWPMLDMSNSIPKEPDPDEKKESKFPCEASYGYPVRCTGTITCPMVEQEIWGPEATPEEPIPPVTLSASGSYDWDCTPPSYAGPKSCMRSGCVTGGISVGIPGCKKCPKLEVSITFCIGGGKFHCNDIQSADGYEDQMVHYKTFKHHKLKHYERMQKKMAKEGGILKWQWDRVRITCDSTCNDVDGNVVCDTTTEVGGRRLAKSDDLPRLVKSDDPPETNINCDREGEPRLPNPIQPEVSFPGITTGDKPEEEIRLARFRSNEPPHTEPTEEELAEFYPKTETYEGPTDEKEEVVTEHGRELRHHHHPHHHHHRHHPHRPHRHHPHRHHPHRHWPHRHHPHTHHPLTRAERKDVRKAEKQCNMWLPKVDNYVYYTGYAAEYTEIEYRVQFEVTYLVLDASLSFLIYEFPGNPQSTMTINQITSSGTSAVQRRAPQCYNSRNNFFEGTKRRPAKNYPLVISGNVKLCLGLCIDVVNGFLLPFKGTQGSNDV